MFFVCGDVVVWGFFKLFFVVVFGFCVCVLLFFCVFFVWFLGGWLMVVCFVFVCCCFICFLFVCFFSFYLWLLL